MTRTTTRIPHVLAVVVTVVALAACGSSGGSEGTATTARDTAKTTTTASAAKTLEILVSNDDGYSADGIDALVKGLQTLPDVEIQVVAPLTNVSGTGGRTTPGAPAITDVKTKSGFPAKAVAGYPTDAVNAAFDRLDLKPDVVIAGNNAGQNLGPAADISGTVAAARAAVAHGVPGVALSQGTGATFDYETGVSILLDWVQDHREALVDGSAPVQVDNFNAPSCATGSVRGLVEVKPDLGGDVGKSLATQDCASTQPFNAGAKDVAAFLIGYATHSLLPAEPASK